jgi:fructose-specific phosphotransferase system component IIB
MAPKEPGIKHITISLETRGSEGAGNQTRNNWLETRRSKGAGNQTHINIARTRGSKGAGNQTHNNIARNTWLRRSREPNT